MWEQEAADVGEAGVNVFADILQFLVLILFHLIISTQENLVNVWCADILFPCGLVWRAVSS